MSVLEDAGELVTEEMMDEVSSFVRSCHQVYRTPTLRNVDIFMRPELAVSGACVTLKLENLQNTGSFKIRGLMNQRRHLPKDVLSGDRSLVTLSAGNYGKAYGFMLQQIGLRGVCVMPSSAPLSRVKIIKNYGVNVELAPTAELVSVIDKYVNQRGSIFLHSYNDINLVAAYASMADEILEDEPDPDIVLVGCGGGALLAGIASRIKTKCPQCRVYGVEPETANTMFMSYRQNRAVEICGATSIAGGLSPPSAGNICYAHCRRYVDDILLVSDGEIINAVGLLFHNVKIVCEPAGCASLAALLSGKVPNTQGKRVVIVLSGGNVTLNELTQLLSS